MKSKEDILKSLSNYNLKTDIDNNFPIIWEVLSNKPNITSQEKPVGILLGGQPGAGKSFATAEIKERLNDNVIIINVDDFRKFHKHFDDFYQLYGNDAPRHTSDFAKKWLRKCAMRQSRTDLTLLLKEHSKLLKNL